MYSDTAASNRLLARAGRDLTWRQVEAGGAKTDSFSLNLVSRDPKLARSVLQDLVGELDRTLGAARGTAETPYENIRGVDGVLLPVTAPEDLVPAGELYSGELVSDPRMQLVLSPPVAAPQPSVENRPASGIAVAGVASASAADEIPYDDARARPLPESAYRTLKMNVIDTPSLPSHAEGLGWWNVAIGTASGAGVGRAPQPVWRLRKRTSGVAIEARSPIHFRAINPPLQREHTHVPQSSGTSPHSPAHGPHHKLIRNLKTRHKPHPPAGSAAARPSSSVATVCRTPPAAYVSSAMTSDNSASRRCQ